MYRRLLVLVLLLCSGIHAAAAVASGQPLGVMQVRVASLCASLGVHVALPTARSAVDGARGGCAGPGPAGPSRTASQASRQAAAFPVPESVRVCLSQVLDWLEARPRATSFRLVLGTVQLRLDTAFARGR